MSRYLQAGLVLSYALLIIVAFLLGLQLSGVFVSVMAGWLVVLAWLAFCFLSAAPVTGIYLFRYGRLRKPVLEEEEKLHRCWDEVLHRASCERKFRLMIEEETDMGAFAAGYHTIVVTRGMLEQMTEEELKGALAHELGHLISGDTIVATAFVTAGWLPRIVQYVCRRLLGAVWRMRRLGLPAGVAALLLLGYLLHRLHVLQAVIPVIAFAGLFSGLNAAFGYFGLLLSRLTEYRQDVYADRLGYGPGLRQALQKLAAERPHPIIYNRIRRLEQRICRRGERLAG
jgi:Zn-dependent protease with chaperone function